MSNELLLEIGTEEIPALFLNKAETDLKTLVEKELKNLSLNFSTVKTFGTPRRLALLVNNLEMKQQDQTIETFGPPKKIAFDESGNPTKAALGFAKSQNVEIEKVEITKRDNGEFLCVKNRLKGRKTSEILKELLPEIINSISFAKSMRWGSGKITFARPIRWIGCVYGGKTVPFSIENIKSSNKSFGHRFNSPKSFKIENFEQYQKTLENNYVILDSRKREKTILDEAKKLANKVKGKLVDYEELMETVVNIIEYPVVLIGEFEKKYLNLPKEVLISVMKNHQKYFPVYKQNSDNLLPYFIFACGTKVRDNEVVIRGNGRVLRARFSDAEFFWDEDRKKPLEVNLKRLESMVFLSKIGSYLEKTKRLEYLSEKIAMLCKKEDIKENVKRAATLSKADLVSQMVFEFPELQGIMGRYYAKESGENEEVATAIEEHYMPTGRDANLPKTEIGALLSIADKIDNICSCFKADLKPTGSADPYALRRQAIGIIQIILNKELNFNLSSLVEDENVINFISDRFKNLMLDEGCSSGVIDSVLSTGFDNVVNCYNKIKAVEEFTKQKGFDELAVAFKRVVNIAKDKPKAEIDSNLFKDKPEKDLYKSFSEIKKKTDKYFDNIGLASESDFLKALNQIKTLKEPVDNFFDNVMVMDKNEKLKNNRLALLNEIKTLFFQISDFSKI